MERWEPAEGCGTGFYLRDTLSRVLVDGDGCCRRSCKGAAVVVAAGGGVENVSARAESAEIVKTVESEHVLAGSHACALVYALSGAQGEARCHDYACNRALTGPGGDPVLAPVGRPVDCSRTDDGVAATAMDLVWTLVNAVPPDPGCPVQNLRFADHGCQTLILASKLLVLLATLCHPLHPYEQPPRTSNASSTDRRMSGAPRSRWPGQSCSMSRTRPPVGSVLIRVILQPNRCSILGRFFFF